MKNIKHIFFNILLLTFLFNISCATKLSLVSRTLSLDQAIQEAAENIEKSMKQGQKIAVLNFTSPSEQFSAYVLEELSEHLVNGRKLVVVDRRELDLIRQEENFQMSGEVSDESAQEIGQKLGAQLIASGSLFATGDTYRLRIRVLNVGSSAVESSSSADISAKEGKVMSLIADTRPALAAITTQTTAASETAPVQPPGTYRIGDRGPAGGIIFYDKGRHTDGWRFLEAAPVSTEFTTIWGVWGVGGYNVPAAIGTGIGSGKRNTQIIVELQSQRGESNSAAQLCTSLNINGFTDWFLPSSDELDLIFWNLKKEGFGDFGNEMYLSSSKSSTNDQTIYALMFRSGMEIFFSGPIQASVRAVRAF